MKFIFALVILIGFLTTICHAQGTNKDIQDAANLAIKKFTWDIQTEAKGSIMFLDVPYDHDGATEYLTMTIAKNKSVARPVFISVIIPSNINQTNGVFIAFAKTIKNSTGEFEVQIEKGLTARLKFEKCDDNDCTTRMVDCYVIDNESHKRVDVLNGFLKYDHVMFLFLYKDGSHKSVSVPLFSFKTQFKALQ
ncbi:hypothetical protein J3L18_26035 [Mucilaginibacter gossypii]|uniref:hypothetical protein n=1 Tax=Mucilaginibacter gossypii TaxID=551996 RepID=UPI000DCD354A|nr:MULTISPECIES: hypothetical protein [Mucilaginibacter]QTE36551.1 hypothetical protein J3L18_26035 [Mucilaginibacter gossypii]RAV47371.1 hypothetical protein DIU36_29680 [Mucilaginibacter rubeus]